MISLYLKNQDVKKIIPGVSKSFSSFFDFPGGFSRSEINFQEVPGVSRSAGHPAYPLVREEIGLNNTLVSRLLVIVYTHHLMSKSGEKQRISICFRERLCHKSKGRFGYSKKNVIKLYYV